MAHFTYNDRLTLEKFQKAKTPIKQIAYALGCHMSTVYRELQRGQYTHLNSDYTTEQRYSPDIAHNKYKAHLKAKGGNLKISNDIALANFIEEKIITEKYSPAAVLDYIRQKGLKFNVTIKSVHTIYNYIDKGVFLNLTNKHLPVRGNKKNAYKKIRPAKRATAGTSIEKRSATINARQSFGHWEMDTVIGKRNGKKEILLVLTERFTRYEIVKKIPNKTASSVVRALDSIERKYGKRFPQLFQSITVDNGCEFSDVVNMLRSVRKKGNRTDIFYCHAYCSWERGSNENQNRLIRRWYPKGTDFSTVTVKEVELLQDWINDYPRRIFNGYSSKDLFEACCSSLH